MNVNNFDLLYRERKTAAGITGSTLTIQAARVDPGRIRVITHVSIENKTSAYTKCRLSVYNGATDFEIDEAIFPDEDELLIHPKDIVLGEGDILRARLTGTTTGDIVEMHIVGWEMKRER